jgi:hypothetical protein
MFMRFKKEGNNFTGVISQSLTEYVDEYFQACNSVGVRRNQHPQHISNLFGGEAKRFYSREIHDKYSTFEEAIAVLEKEYSSFPRQQRILSYLENLRIPPLLHRGSTKSEALHHVWQEITRLSGQCPPSHRSDENKVAMLRAAVIENSWARDPISRAATQPLKLPTLYTKPQSRFRMKRLQNGRARLDTVGSSQILKWTLSRIRRLGKLKIGWAFQVLISRGRVEVYADYPTH